MTLNIANVLEAKGDFIKPNICNLRHVLPMISGSLNLLMDVFIFQQFFVLQHFGKRMQLSVLVYFRPR